MHVIGGPCGAGISVVLGTEGVQMIGHGHEENVDVLALSNLGDWAVQVEFDVVRLYRRPGLSPLRTKQGRL